MLPSDHYINEIDSMNGMFASFFDRVLTDNESSLVKLPDGTLLIKNIPKVAPEAYLHQVFSPLNIEEIDLLEQAVGAGIPEDYKVFLQQANGLSLFSNSIALHGYKKSYSRTTSVREPFSLASLNENDRPFDSPIECFFIGSYRSDGSLLYLTRKDNRIHRCTRDSIRPIDEWKNLQECLLSEYERIGRLFTPDGYKKQPNTPTHP